MLGLIACGMARAQFVVQTNGGSTVSQGSTPDQFGNLFRYRSRVNPDGRSSDPDVGKTAYDVFFTTLANP